MAAGTTAPPTAAATGRAARRGLGQLPGDQLALDLQADGEEKDGHQPIVDPVEERFGQAIVADTDGELRLPEPRVTSAHGEFAHSSARSAASRRTTPPVDSARANLAKIAVTRLEECRGSRVSARTAVPFPAAPLRHHGPSLAGPITPYGRRAGSYNSTPITGPSTLRRFSQRVEKVPPASLGHR